MLVKTDDGKLVDHADVVGFKFHDEQGRSTATLYGEDEEILGVFIGSDRTDVWNKVILFMEPITDDPN